MSKTYLEEFYWYIFGESGIIHTAEDATLLISWISEVYEGKNILLKLLWKATRDGFEADTFHQRCDDKGATLSIVKSDKNKIFGGLATMSWKANRFVHDSSAFIFSLTHKTNHDKQVDKFNSMYSLPAYGPTFGAEYDIYIANNRNKEACSTSNPHAYNLTTPGNEIKYYAKSRNFLVIEIEVYVLRTPDS